MTCFAEQLCVLPVLSVKFMELEQMYLTVTCVDLREEMVMSLIKA